MKDCCLRVNKVTRFTYYYRIEDSILTWQEAFDYIMKNTSLSRGEIMLYMRMLPIEDSI